MSFASGCLGPLLYLVMALLPIVLKWADAPRFVALSWWKVTSLLWAPWSMLVLLAIGGWLIELVQRRRARARG